MRTPEILNQRSGFGLIEILIAAVVLIIAILGLATVYLRGRQQLDHEEDRRKATAAAQFRIEQIRSYPFDDIPGLFDDNDSTMTIDGVTFDVAVDVAPGPNAFIHQLQATVTWDLPMPGETRSVTVTTYVGKVLQPQPTP